MRTKVLMAIAIAVLTSLIVNAQSQRMQLNSGRRPIEVRQVIRPGGGFALPDRSLNDQQREEIQKIRTEQFNALNQTSNQLREKRARLETLQNADNPDMNEINKAIDEIAALQAQEMKAQAATRQQVRNLLTDEQRAVYDRRSSVIRENLRANRNIRIPNDRFREQRQERQERLDRPDRFNRPERPERPERPNRLERSDG